MANNDKPGSKATLLLEWIDEARSTPITEREGAVAVTLAGIIKIKNALDKADNSSIVGQHELAAYEDAKKAAKSDMRNTFDFDEMMEVGKKEKAPRYVLINAGKNVNPELQCSNGRNPSPHPANVLFILDRKSTATFYAVVRDWDKGKLFSLNHRENYVTCALQYIDNQPTESDPSRNTMGVQECFEILYEMFQETRVPVLLNTAMNVLEKHYKNPSKGLVTIGGLLFPSSLIFETKETMIGHSKLSFSSPINISPFLLKSEKSTSSKRGGDQSKKKAEDKDKGKGRRKKAAAASSSSSSGSSMIDDVQALEDADFLGVCEKIAAEETQDVVQSYPEIFAGLKMSKGAKIRKEHILKKIHKGTHDVIAQAHHDGKAHPLHERFVFASLEAMSNPQSELATQINLVKQKVAEKAKEGVEVFSFVHDPLGPQYIGSRTPPKGDPLCTQLIHNMNYYVAVNAVEKTVETVEHAWKQRVQRMMDKVAKEHATRVASAEKRADEAEQLRRETIELRKVAAASEKQIEKERTAAARDLAEKEMECKELNKRISDLEAELKSAIAAIPSKPASQPDRKRKNEVVAVKEESKKPRQFEVLQKKLEKEEIEESSSSDETSDSSEDHSSSEEEAGGLF